MDAGQGSISNDKNVRKSTQRCPSKTFKDCGDCGDCGVSAETVETAETV